MNPFRNRKPVQEPAAFYGRAAELETICQHLATQPPQCCAVVGPPRSGKTSLLYYVRHQAQLDEQARRLDFGTRQHVLAIYVNAGPYIDLGAFQLHGVLYFWRDIYLALAQALPAAPDLPPLPEPGHSETTALDQIHTIRCSIAAAIRESPAELVLLLLDNAEGIARLPAPTGSLLRTLTQDPALSDRVAYVATSQVPLYRLYDPATWQAPSSFWSLFAEIVYLGQLEPAAAHALMQRSNGSPPAASFSPQEQAMLLSLAGRHPDMLTLACALLYDQHSNAAAPQHLQHWQRFEEQLFEAVLPLCQALWQFLRVTPGAHEVLLHLANGQQPASAAQLAALPELSRQGIITFESEERRIFSALMARFVRQQAALLAAPESPPERAPLPYTAALEPEHTEQETALDLPAFTHLEGAVYAFLAAHAGIVCDRESIKRAVWDADPPSDSALQKLIERIREKIERDPRHPRRLLAVRGQGYILYPDDLSLQHSAASL
jgi:hypothetical protein